MAGRADLHSQNGSDFIPQPTLKVWRLYFWGGIKISPFLDQAWMGIVSKALQRAWVYSVILVKEMPTLHWPWTLSGSFLPSSSTFLITPDLFIALVWMLLQPARRGCLKASVFRCARESSAPAAWRLPVQTTPSLQWLNVIFIESQNGLAVDH